MKFIIQLENITVKREDRPILNNISLSIEDGQSVAIIGSNGAGKSTLVDVMSEQVHPVQTEGTKRLLFGDDNWNIVELQKKMGIVSQSLQYLCNTNYSVEEIVLSGFFSSIGLDFHHIITHEMHNRVNDVLSEYHMKHLKDNRMNTLSSGEARKALLMRASVHSPSVMLLDEVTTNLDLPSKKEYLKHISEYAHGEKTVILVTHDISQIVKDIERVIVLKDGKILADGPKDHILSEELLSEAYSTKVFVSRRDGRYNAWC